MCENNLLAQPVDINTETAAADTMAPSDTPPPIGEEDASDAAGADRCQNDAGAGSDKEQSVSLNAISDKLDGLSKLLSKLVEEEIRRAEYEEKIVDKMRHELQKYREDVYYSQLIRPLLLDMIEIRDSISRVAAAHQARPEGERDIPNKTFALYAAEIQDILEKNKVEIFKSEIGTDFAPVKQRALKKTAAGDESWHGKVAESLSDGYSHNGKVISAEKVAVYYYEKPSETETEITTDMEDTRNG